MFAIRSFCLSIRYRLIENGPRAWGVLCDQNIPTVIERKVLWNVWRDDQHHRCSVSSVGRRRIELELSAWRRRENAWADEWGGGDDRTKNGREG